MIIAFDGRALGVPPFDQYNHAFLLPAGTPMSYSTARRFDALIRVGHGLQRLRHGEVLRHPGAKCSRPAHQLVKTAQIPIVIN